MNIHIINVIEIIKGEGEKPDLIKLPIPLPFIPRKDETIQFLNISTINDKIYKIVEVSHAIIIPGRIIGKRQSATQAIKITVVEKSLIITPEYKDSLFVDSKIIGNNN